MEANEPMLTDRQKAARAEDAIEHKRNLQENGIPQEVLGALLLLSFVLFGHLNGVSRRVLMACTALLSGFEEAYLQVAWIDACVVADRAVVA
ncbi:MAG: hypothetical protein KHY83_07350 [Coriobacteriia bacterium]|nr:hypothetical protein [Coriobacteriia bacterium]MBS5478461.1 hypothetical protein [Coriobacteriia bacterium]